MVLNIDCETYHLAMLGFIEAYFQCFVLFSGALFNMVQFQQPLKQMLMFGRQSDHNISQIS